MNFCRTDVPVFTIKKSHSDSVISEKKMLLLSGLKDQGLLDFSTYLSFGNLSGTGMLSFDLLLYSLFFFFLIITLFNYQIILISNSLNCANANALTSLIQ